MNTAKKTLLIAQLTVRDIIRQPVCLVLLSSLLTFVLLLPVLITHSLEETRRLVLDSALALQLLGGMLLAGFGASSSISRELEKGTALTIISKPIPRAAFFTGKFIGVCLFLLLYMTASCAAAGLSMNIAAYYEEQYTVTLSHILTALAVPIGSFALAGILNYTSGIPFTSTAFYLHTILAVMAGVDSGSHYNQLIPACILLCLAAFVFAALATACSIRMKTVPVLAVLTVFFFLGLAADYLANLLPSGAGTIVSWLLPHWQFFWAADALHAGLAISPGYIGLAAAYSLFYGTAVLMAGLWSFNNVELS